MVFFTIWNISFPVYGNEINFTGISAIKSLEFWEYILWILIDNTN